MDGFTVLRRLREARSTIPIIVLTARDAVTDTVAGLEGGADDYVAKPFRFDELLARVRLRLRPSDRIPEVTVLRSGGLALDLRTRRADVDGRTVELSAREFALAESFLRNPGQVLSREQLLSQVWGYDFDPGSNIVEVYVRYLRHKVGRERIATVRGMVFDSNRSRRLPITKPDEEPFTFASHGPQRGHPSWWYGQIGRTDRREHHHEAPHAATAGLLLAAGIGTRVIGTVKVERVRR